MDKKELLLAIGMGRPEEEESEYPEFDIPEGVDLADLKDGEEKEVVAVVRKKDDGRACFVSINGVQIGEAPEYEEEEEVVEESGDGLSSTLPAESGLGERARTAGLM